MCTGGSKFTAGHRPFATNQSDQFKTTDNCIEEAQQPFAPRRPARRPGLPKAPNNWFPTNFLAQSPLNNGSSDSAAICAGAAAFWQIIVPRVRPNGPARLGSHLSLNRLPRSRNPHRAGP
jgi:hypothetical protein